MGKYFTDKYQKNKTPASFHPFEEKYNKATIMTNATGCVHKGESIVIPRLNVFFINSRKSILIVLPIISSTPDTILHTKQYWLAQISLTA